MFFLVSYRFINIFLLILFRAYSQFRSICLYDAIPWKMKYFDTYIKMTLLIWKLLFWVATNLEKQILFAYFFLFILFVYPYTNNVNHYES